MMPSSESWLNYLDIDAPGLRETSVFVSVQTVWLKQQRQFVCAEEFIDPKKELHHDSIGYCRI